MIKKSVVKTIANLIFSSLILTGCVEYEAHGHYKFDERRIKEKMTKDEVLKTFGTPLKITENDNVIYYVYSHIKKTSFGYNTEPENRILRMEFKNGVLEKYELLNYTDYKANSERTEEPDMNISILGDIMKGGVELTHSEKSKEMKENFKNAKQ